MVVEDIMVVEEITVVEEIVEEVVTEEDVLHMRSLPDFNKRLSAQDVELLVQYLLAPYIRIPLLLNSVLCELRMNPEEQVRRLSTAERRISEALDWEFDAEIGDQLYAKALADGPMGLAEGPKGPRPYGLRPCVAQGPGSG